MLGLKDMAAIVAEHGEALDVALSPIKLTDEFTIADGRPALMGVVNLSPDSWYRESVCLSVDAAVQRGRVLSELGASVVDIGAESTLGQAERVDANGQQQRLLPVIRQLADEGIVISAETYDFEVAKPMLENLGDYLEESTASALMAATGTSVEAVGLALSLLLPNIISKPFQLAGSVNETDAEMIEIERTLRGMSAVTQPPIAATKTSTDFQRHIRSTRWPIGIFSAQGRPAQNASPATKAADTSR